MAVTFSKLGQFGRLGNQMFQIASTIGIAGKNNLGYAFPEWKYQQYFKNHLFWSGFAGSQVIKEKNFHYDEYFLPKGTNYDLQGYFQSEKYWEHCKDEVLSYFEFEHHLKIFAQMELSKAGIMPTAIHVRRGDYLNLSDYHTNLTLDYYNNAIELFSSRKFIVFSDDIKWCKENFKGERFMFSENKTEIEDMCLMSLCENNIIANSSFSWWAQMLNKSPNKIVVAPSKDKWFGEKMRHVSVDDLYLDNWILI